MHTPDASVLRSAWHHLLARLPSECAVCHSWPARRLCDDCIALLAQPQPRCTGCALVLPAAGPRCSACLRTPPVLEHCVAAVDYAWPWADIIAQFKFHGDPGWAATLASLMAHTPWAEPLLDAADLLVPVPLSPQRLRERGYHQALLLARALAPQKTHAHLLQRVHDTPAQSGLGRKDRLRNLAGAMQVAAQHAGQIQGRHVLLVDDVMTTGATLHTAALALRQAGAAKVSALVLARTPETSPG